MSKLGSNINSGLGIELGSMSNATRNAGVSTATGTVIYNSTSQEVQVYKGSIGWTNISAKFIEATGGIISVPPVALKVLESWSHALPFQT